MPTAVLSSFAPGSPLPAWIAPRSPAAAAPRRLQAAVLHALDLLRLLELPSAAAGALAARGREVDGAEGLSRWLLDAARALDGRAGDGRSLVFRAKMAKVLPESLGERLMAGDA